MEGNEVLSIEQMKHLKELGVDATKASLYIWKEGHGDIVISNGNAPEMGDAMPVFTLEDMLEIMPPTLYSDKKGSTIRLEPISYFYKHILTVTKDIAGYMVEYRDYNKGVTLTYDEGRTALEAAYNMLCWLVENKLLVKEEK